jgi:hypothetical protein
LLAVQLVAIAHAPGQVVCGAGKLLSGMQSIGRFPFEKSLKQLSIVQQTIMQKRKKHDMLFSTSVKDRLKSLAVT